LKLEIGNPAKQQPAAARTSHDVCIWQNDGWLENVSRKRKKKLPSE
jgi:hypothetical protein